MPLTRRNIMTAAAATFAHSHHILASPPAAQPGPICLFSKHLPGLDPRRLAQACKDAGFGGVDLTVRKGGHVSPDRVEVDLPTAVSAIRAVGLEVPHITTGLESGTDPLAAAVLETAGNLKIPFFRAAHHSYQSDDVDAEITRVGSALGSLVDRARAHGIQMLYQNHVGKFGAPLWDYAQVLDHLDPRWAGMEFDIRHAVAEGGASAWRTGFQRIAARVRMICVKDFYWKKGPAGWQIQDCPLGEGMVDFPAFCAMLARRRFLGPVSLHLEYLEKTDRPGAESRVLAAAARDLQLIKQRLSDAYG